VASVATYISEECLGSRADSSPIFCETVVVANLKTKDDVAGSTAGNPCCSPPSEPCDPSLVCPEFTHAPAAGRTLTTGIAVMIPISLALWAAVIFFAWWLLF
jgi:hypothetical protein